MVALSFVGNNRNFKQWLARNKENLKHVDEQIEAIRKMHSGGVKVGRT